jgi:diguanylate cyclase (GGDEF)-like protein
MKFNLQSIDDRLIVTNLPDRAWFKRKIATAIARAKRDRDYQFAVLFLDLDRFRTINDSLGHSVGDRLLFHVAHRLLKSVRIIDTVARLGGDEFAVLLENLQNPYKVDVIAQRIGQELSTPFNIEGQQVYTNASIGIVFSSIGYHNVDDLFRDADIAMYRAKVKGKGRYEVFNTAMRDRAIAASQLENDLQRAIVKRRVRGSLSTHSFSWRTKN